LRILFWIVRALAILLLIRIILRSLFGSRRPAARAQGAPGPGGRPQAQERIGGELVRDPNCGTYIPKARALVVGSGDAAQYFCSTECREAYAKVQSSKSEVRS
jgi:YHS domain-containing protein